MDTLKRVDAEADILDASIFSGDILYIEGGVDMLDAYVQRWSRAIAERRADVCRESAEKEKKL